MECGVKIRTKDGVRTVLLRGLVSDFILLHLIGFECDCIRRLSDGSFLVELGPDEFDTYTVKVRDDDELKRLVVYWDGIIYGATDLEFGGIPVTKGAAMFLGKENYPTVRRCKLSSEISIWEIYEEFDRDYPETAYQLLMCADKFKP